MNEARIETFASAGENPIMPDRLVRGVVMIRAIAITGLILGLVALAVFGQRMFGGADEGLASKQSAAPTAQCDLLQGGPCLWSTEAGDWEVSLNRLGEGAQGKEYRLTVTTPEQPERFLAVLRGESMYMGEYPVPLGNREGKEYSARFSAPFCTQQATMTWRIDLQQGQTPIANIPLKLIFQAKAVNR